MGNFLILTTLLGVLCCGVAGATEPSARQTLPETSAAWTELLREALALPRAAWQILSAQLPDTLHDTQNVDRALMLAAALLWLAFSVWLYRRMNRAAASDHYSGPGLLGKLLRATHELLRGNRINITVTGLALIVLPLAKTPWPSADIVPILTLAWLGY